jgi:hypothetical protein
MMEHSVCCHCLYQIISATFNQRVNIRETDILEVVARRIAILRFVNEALETVEYLLLNGKYQQLGQKWLDHLKQKIDCEFFIIPMARGGTFFTFPILVFRLSGSFDGERRAKFHLGSAFRRSTFDISNVVQRNQFVIQLRSSNDRGKAAMTFLGRCRNPIEFPREFGPRSTGASFSSIGFSTTATGNTPCSDISFPMLSFWPNTIICSYQAHIANTTNENGHGENQTSSLFSSISVNFFLNHRPWLKTKGTTQFEVHQRHVFSELS